MKNIGYILFALFVAAFSIYNGYMSEQYRKHCAKLSQELVDLLNQEWHEEIMFKINAGADVDTTSSNGLTALMIAAKNNDLNLLKWLINRKLKHYNVPNLDKETPWDQPHAGKPALSFALEAKNIDAVKLLVEAGANVNLYNDLGTVENRETVPESLRERNPTLLIYAIGRKLPMPFITLLLSSKAVNVDKSALLGTITPLMIAAAIGYEDAVKALLEKGANKEIINKNDNKKAIDYARDAGYENIVKLLT